MELNRTVQVALNDLNDQSFDLLIASSGYETRCIFLSQRYSTFQVKDKIVLAFKERCHEISRPINDQVFLQLGFKCVESSLTSTVEIREILDNACSAFNGQEMNILIDYSSMPKLWYDAIINFFIEKETEASNIFVWFSYTPSEYCHSLSDVSYNFAELDIPAPKRPKPKALILGLGYEKGRAQQLANQLNAQVTYSFYSDPAVDNRFVDELLDNNSEILRKLDVGKVIKYPIYDLNYINATLTQLCVDLRLTHQVVLAPIGPKPFTLMCFLLNARYPDINIWRFSSSVHSNICDRKPHGELLVYKVHFTSDDVDYDD